MMNEMCSHLLDLHAVRSTGIDLKTKSEPLVNRQLTLGTFCKYYDTTPQNLDEAMQRLGKVFDHHLPMIALKATTGKKLYG